MERFICEGWCSLPQDLEEDQPPKQITHFEGIWRQAYESGWRFTTDTKWSRDRTLICLCPECAKREGIK